MLISLLLLACTSDDPGTDSGTAAQGTEAVDPTAAGSWPVGTDSEEIVGTSGVTLAVQAWYPSAEDSGSKHEYDGLVESEVAIDRADAACDSARPVLMFSHGNSGMRWQSYFLTEFLASHGWVVVAPDHTGNTIFDMDDARTPELIFRRPVDIADSFDRLLVRSADPEDRLFGCVDADDGYVVAGHSFGGFTSLVVAGAVIDTEATAAFCATNGGWLCDEVATYAAEHPEQTVWDLSDSRARAAVPMAPAAYETLIAGLGLITVPTMVLAGQDDSLTPWLSVVKPIWDGLAVSPRAAARLADTGHFSFSNACELVSTYEECSPPFLDPAEVHSIVTTLTLSWALQQTGRGDFSAWLPPEDDRIVWDSE